MSFLSSIVSAFVSLLLLCGTTGLCMAGPTAPEVEEFLDKNILPVLEQRCFDCHDNDVSKGDINLATLTDPKNPLRNDVRLWIKIREQLRAGTMPPKNKPPLEAPAQEAILHWMKSHEQVILARAPTDPGLRKTRRLTREEYNLTLRDLLGIKSRPADKFPADGSGGEGFSNNSDTLMFSPLLMEKYLEGAETALAEVWANPELKHRLFKPVDSDKLPAEEGARLLLQPFLLQAYRRPPTEEDMQGLLTVFRSALKRGLKWDPAVRVTFKAALMSPHFLFLEEKRLADTKEPWKINDYELATRLSYFLWSSKPDDELFKLAAENKLNDDATLEAQTKRMLADPKAAAFPKLFAGEWLRFEELFNSVDPDRRKFKEFNDELRQSMYDEILQFSDNILRNNGRVLDFLDSDYSYLNETLAKLYGIPNVTGSEFRQVKFTDKRRGGLVGMGAILATTSYPQRTSPVLRGKWVLEQLLGTPPPPPPPNVGGLPEDDRTLKEGTLRQRLEAHRAKPVCAGCHVRMDPLGFGLENFNPIGQWRDDENGKPLDVSGSLPGDLRFNGPAEMRKVLMAEKDLFSRTFCSRLLGYALGHGLEVVDQPTLLKLEEVLKKNNYHSEPLIIALVKSYPFRWRK